MAELVLGVWQQLSEGGGISSCQEFKNQEPSAFLLVHGQALESVWVFLHMHFLEIKIPW